MATRTEVTEWMVCDLHESEHEATETIEFAMEGIAYSIDLCEGGAERQRRALSPFIEAAQVVQSGRKRNRARANSNGNSSNGQSENDRIRAWARGKGYEVSDRGRIAGEVVLAYKEAHKRSRAAAPA